MKFILEIVYVCLCGIMYIILHAWTLFLNIEEKGGGSRQSRL